MRPGACEPYQGLDVGNARIRDCLILGARAFRWVRRHRAAACLSSPRIALGVSLAAATHINGSYPAEEEATTVTMALKAGGQVELVLALHDLGSGALTTVVQIAAESLGARPDMFDVTPADSDLTPYDLGTRASRTTYVCGEAARRTAEMLKSEIRRKAEIRAEGFVSPAFVVLRRGRTPLQIH